MVHVRGGARALAEANRLERAAFDLRGRKARGGRDAIAERVRALDVETLRTSRTPSRNVHYVTSRRNKSASACSAVASERGSSRDRSPTHARTSHGPRRPDAIRAILGASRGHARAHGATATEARRRTVIDHLADVSVALDALDDPRSAGGARARRIDALRSPSSALLHRRIAHVASQRGGRGARRTSRLRADALRRHAAIVRELDRRARTVLSS